MLVLRRLKIDLLKHENHSPTPGFLDTMYSYGMFTLKTKPIRLTEDIASFKGLRPVLEGVVITMHEDGCEQSPMNYPLQTN